MRRAGPGNLVWSGSVAADMAGQKAVMIGLCLGSHLIYVRLRAAWVGLNLYSFRDYRWEVK